MAGPLMASLVGVAVPLLVSGRATMAAALIPGLVCAALVPGAGGHARRAIDAARRPLPILLAVTFAAWLPSVAASLMPWESLEAWGRTVLFVAAAAFLWAVLAADRRLLSACLRALVVGSAVAAAAGLVSLLWVPELHAMLRGIGWQPLVAADGLKEFASAAMLLAPVAAWAGHRLGGGWTAAGAAAAAGLVGVIVLTGSGSATAGIAVAGAACAALWAWRHRSRKRPIVVVLAGAAVLVAAVLATYDRPLSRHFAPSDRGALGLPAGLVDPPRQVIWQSTFDIWLREPWLGHGINAVNHVPGADEPVVLHVRQRIPGHPHNWLLEILAETGVVGFLPAIVFVAAMLASRVRRYLASPSPAALAALAVYVGFWVSGLFNFSFWSAWWQLAFMVLMAVALAGEAARENAGEPGSG